MASSLRLPPPQQFGISSTTALLSTAMASSLRLPLPQLKCQCILLRDSRSSATTSTFDDDFPLKSDLRNAVEEWKLKVVEGDGKHLKTSVLENENSESKPDERGTGTRENSVKPTKPPKGKADEIFGPINGKVDGELLNSLIKVNVEETTKVTQVVLPGMLKRKKGYCEYWFWYYECIPSDPLYAATKAFRGGCMLRILFIGGGCNI